MGEGAPGGTGLKGSILSPSTICAQRGECAREVTAQNSGRASAGEAGGGLGARGSIQKHSKDQQDENGW